MNYSLAFVLFIVFVVIYLYNDRKRVKKNEESVCESKRLDALEERLSRQDALMGDFAGRIDDLTENVREIREDICKVVPVSGQNVI